MTYKVGDKVRITKRQIDEYGQTDDCYWVELMDNYDGQEITVTELTKSGRVRYEGWCFVPAWLDLITETKTKTSMSISSIIKTLTRGEPEKTFVVAGFIDENEEVTTKGREALEHVLWTANKDALKTLADQVVAAEAQEKK